MFSLLCYVAILCSQETVSAHGHWHSHLNYVVSVFSFQFYVLEEAEEVLKKKIAKLPYLTPVPTGPTADATENWKNISIYIGRRARISVIDVIIP